MDQSRQPPRSVVAACILLGIVIVGALVITAGAVYYTVTAEGMGGLLVPVFILIGTIEVVGGVGCAITIPKLLRGTHRVPVTWFAAITLLPNLYLGFVAVSNLAIVLLWAPRAARKFFRRHLPA